MNVVKLLSISLTVLIVLMLSSNASSQSLDLEEIAVDSTSLQEAIDEMERTGATHLNILLSNGTISLDQSVLSFLLSSGAEEVKFSITKVEPMSLTANQASVASDRPVYDIRIVGDEDIIDFGGAAITVTLPYEMLPSESSSDLCVWHLNDEGIQETINGTYEGGFISFETKHLSYFAVGYEAGATADRILQYLLLTALIIVFAAILIVYFMHKKQAL